MAFLILKLHRLNRYHRTTPTKKNEVGKTLKKMINQQTTDLWGSEQKLET